MKWHGVLLILLNIMMIIGFTVYWINPSGKSTFFTQPKIQNPDFNLGNNTAQMQFYPNMRFPTKDISYKISSNCSLSKKQNMVKAFERISNYTQLRFYPVLNSPEINIYCQEKSIVNSGMYIAGEGGPTNITNGTNFKVIFNGEILLIRNSECSKPNVATHELLHVLGFNHSKNIANIMYPVSKCDQEIGQDTINKLNSLYSIPSYPDLAFTDASAHIDGRSLDLNLSISNEGLADSSNSSILVYTDDKLVKKLSLDSIQIGHGVQIQLQNVWLSRLNFNQLKIVIESPDKELSNDNNKIILSKN
jgi:hypothetical protein